MDFKLITKDRTLEISSKPEERTHIWFNQKSGEYEVTTSPIPCDQNSGECKVTPLPIPSIGGCLRRCLTFVKDWNGVLFPAVGFVMENFPRLVLIVWALFRFLGVIPN